MDNRYLIASLIACDRDTPRIVEPEIFSSVFDLQEKVIANIFSSVEEQKAREAAPRSIDPIQQTVATAIQGYLSHPEVDRARAVETIRFVSQPMRKTQVTRLRQAYKEFQRTGGIKALLDAVEDVRTKFGEAPARTPGEPKSAPSVSREDLRLICFDVLSG